MIKRIIGRLHAVSNRLFNISEYLDRIGHSLEQRSPKHRDIYLLKTLKGHLEFSLAEIEDIIEKLN
jgi:hypothetical protein